jgi:hypothetical protein
VLFSFSKFNLKKEISYLFHLDDRSRTSNTFDMILGQDILEESDKILNFNDKIVIWYNDSIDALVEVYLTETETQHLVDKFSSSNKILDSE